MNNPVHFWSYLAQFCFEWEIVLDKSCTESQNTNFMFNNFFFFFSENHPVYENNVEKYCRTRQATDDNAAHAHFMRIPKATNAHSEFIMLSAFPLQQLLHGRASLLSCTHTVCLANHSAQFLTTDDKTVPASPTGCHIPSAFQFTIRQSFYHVQGVSNMTGTICV